MAGPAGPLAAVLGGLARYAALAGVSASLLQTSMYTGARQLGALRLLAGWLAPACLWSLLAGPPCCQP